MRFHTASVGSRPSLMLAASGCIAGWHAEDIEAYLEVLGEGEEAEEEVK